ncbi:MAG: hypothetical protein L0G69_05220 [Brevibacterium sp.]|nr:hypothetical protein [Brevibacterium sp.]
MKVITTDNASATQTEHPWRSALRTVLQVALFAYPVFLALPEILKVIDEDLGEFLPDEARAKLLLVATVIAAGAGALARIMAIPAVEKALRKIGAGAAPTELTFGDWTGADSDEVIPVEDNSQEEVADGDDAEPGGLADEEDPEPIIVSEANDDADPEGPADDETLEALAAEEVDDTPPLEGYRPRH